MADAPTLAEILDAGHGLSIHCARCRLVVMLFAEKLVKSRDPARPIDRFRFRCHRCGAIGAPIVTSEGNTLMGHARIWP